jgi:hypothetical protein
MLREINLFGGLTPSLLLYFLAAIALRFSPSLGEDSRRKGRYKVVRQLPEAGNAFQYRIKSETDGHERVVREDQIERW